jgi:hypothetical protein
MSPLRIPPLVFAVACFFLARVAGLAAAEDPLQDAEVQKTLRAMNDASTWYHPDLFGEYAGMQRYARGNYREALRYFEIGAYYADKLSQLCIGLLYYNGEGVAKDLVTAYAWLDLAAERDYPDFIATRDRVRAELTPEQLAKAEALRSELVARYGDAVAKPRMEQQLRFGQAQMTGSHTGFDFGAYHTSTRPDCRATAAIGGVTVPSAGCGGNDLFAKSRWDPKLYFAARDAEWKATVRVGELRTSPIAAPPAEPKPATAPAAH